VLTLIRGASIVIQPGLHRSHQSCNYNYRSASDELCNIGFLRAIEEGGQQMMKYRFLIIVWLGASALSLTLLAQQETGSIIGAVTDPSGSDVPAAQVTIKNRATGAAFEATTDATGTYRAPQLAPGVYNISVMAKGFSTLVRPAIEVRVDDRLRVDFTLQVGTVNETITVAAAAPLLQVEDASIGQVIDNQKITQLPLNGRNWLQLATLASGTVVYSNTMNAGNQNDGNDQGLRLGGLSYNQTQFLLDGADNTNLISYGPVVGLPLDALQEFKVQTNNYTADTTGFSGAVLNAAIKSGSNTLHGTAYEFFRNRVLNARNFFSPSTEPKPQLNRNQFGASIGGPFLRDKLFFFLNYEGTRQRQAETRSTTVFTAAQKAGDFSASLGPQIGTDALGRPVYEGEIFDPFSVRRLSDGTPIRDPFPGNVIPLSRMNPVAKQLIDLTPAPMIAGSPNFIRSISNPLNVDMGVVRIDWVRSAKNTVFGHAAYNNQGGVIAPLLGLPLVGGNGGSDLIQQRQFLLGWTHVFSPTKLNELRLGYTRNASLAEGPESNLDLNAQYGIPFPFQGAHVGGLTNLKISGYARLGAPTDNPFFQFVNKYQIGDAYTIIRGAHSLKFGVDLRQKLFYNQINSNCGRGKLDFTGVFTRQVGFANTGSSIADFLTGVANFACFGNVTNEKDILHDVEGYIQDKWQVTRKLSISLGMRYIYNPPSWEARDHISSVLFGPGYSSPQIVVPEGQDEATFRFMQQTLFPFITVRRAPELTRGLVYSTKGDFAPRIGIAYQIGRKTVLRTGYGIFYGYPEQVGGNILSVNPPSKLSISNTSNGVDPTMFIDQSVFGPNPFNRALTNPDFFSVRDPYLPAAFTQMYNLGVQHEFGSNWLLEIGYVGHHSDHINITTSVNDAVPALPNDTSSVQSRRRASSLLGDLPYSSPQGLSNYNSLIVNVEKRFSNGSSLLANYTWSRALGNAQEDFQAQDPLNLGREYGPLPFDVRNRVNVAYVYELPFGKGKHFVSKASRPIDLALGGWQLSGITTFQGGLRTTPFLTFSLGKTTTNSRPDVVGDPTKGTARQPSDWINPDAFAVPTDAQIAAGDFFGNSGVGVIAEPGMVNFDLSIIKKVELRERIGVQLRTEFFNLTNTPFFGLRGALDTTFGDPAFGKITQAGDARVVQFGVKVIF
jgi:hypothetical protein